MRFGFILLLLGSLSCGIALGQSSSNARKPTPAATAEDISGMYSFERDGEFVQITVESGTSREAGKALVVSGFISRYGDLDSDKGVFLDHFFSKGSLQQQDLTFATKTVHGVFYEFNGVVEHGPAKSRADEGYFVLKGTLKKNSIEADKKITSVVRHVTFKSFPNLDDSQAKE